LEVCLLWKILTTKIKYQESEVSIMSKEFTEHDIELNNRQKHVVPLLRFVDEGEDVSKEETRNNIWNLFYYDNKTPREIADYMGLGTEKVRGELKICREKYDQWIKDYGLSLYGEEAHRLEDHICDLQKDIADINEILIDDAEELTPKDVREYMKLRGQFRAELAKYKGVTPATKVSLEVTSAEATRARMAELFPDE